MSFKLLGDFEASGERYFLITGCHGGDAAEEDNDQFDVVRSTETDKRPSLLVILTHGG